MINIRSMHPQDIGQVVDIHLMSFTGFFLSFLGKEFLTQLYSGIINDPNGIAFVYEDQKIMGFVAGTTQPANFYRRLIVRRWWRFCIASLAPILRKPGIIPRLVRAFNMPKSVTSEPNRGTLLSIAVSPNFQGRGCGEALVKAFLGEAAKRGLRKVDLTTDVVNNDPVNKLYQKLGFVIDRSFVTPEGRLMNEYLYIIQ